MQPTLRNAFSQQPLRGAHFTCTWTTLRPEPPLILKDSGALQGRASTLTRKQLIDMITTRPFHVYTWAQDARRWELVALEVTP